MTNFSINKIILIVCCTVAIYAIFLIYSDVSKISDEINKFDIRFVPLIMSLVVSGWFCLFLRWHLLLKNQNIIIPKKKSIFIYFSSFGLSIIPGKVGELIKSQLLKKEFNIPIKSSAPIVVVEQIYTVLGLILVSIAGIWYFEIGAYIIIIFGMIFLLILIIIRSKKLFKKVCSILGKIKITSKFIEPIYESHNVIQNTTNRRIAIYATGLSTLFWVLECITVFLIFTAFGLKLDLLTVIPTYTSSMILGVASFLPLGMGVVEGTLTGFFTLHGIEVSIAFTLVIIIRIFTRWIAVSFGFISLKLSGGFSRNE